jgi:anti-sigma B factor antagonist
VESKTPEDRLWVCVAGRVALVRVQGRGSFVTGAPLKEFILSAVEHGAEAAVVDLDGCTGMDSTFMGVLAGAASRLRTRTGGKLSLVNLTPKTHELITTLGLDHVAAAYDVGQMPAEFADYFSDAKLERLSNGAASKLQTAETVLEAHEVLSSLTPENKPRFKDVIEFLRQDVKKATEASGR